MKKEQLKTLQDQMTKHKEELEKRYPISSLILGSIETLFMIDADDQTIRSWYGSQRELISRVKVEIADIENSSLQKTKI